MELNVADIFAWLAFVEVLSLENFKLAMAVGVEDFALAMAIGASQLITSHDSRLLLLPGPPFTYPADVRDGDIVCVCPGGPAGNVAVVAKLFRDLAGDGVRTCLIHRAESPHGPAEMAAAVTAKLWVEWPTPNSNGKSLSGLVLSDRWNPDAPGRAAKTIARFITTLASETAGACSSSNPNAGREASS